MAGTADHDTAPTRSKLAALPLRYIPKVAEVPDHDTGTDGSEPSALPLRHTSMKMVESAGISPTPSGLQASALFAPVRAAINPHRRTELRFEKWSSRGASIPGPPSPELGALPS